MDSDKPSPVRRLPLMRTFADAELVAAELKDPFYLVAFQVQFWLGELMARAGAQYAENKLPRERSLQSGEAWRALTALFNLKPSQPCSTLLGCLYRFSVEDNSPRNTLRHALTRLSIEHHCTGDYFGPKTMRQFGRESSVESREARPDKVGREPKFDGREPEQNGVARRSKPRKPAPETTKHLPANRVGATLNSQPSTLNCVPTINCPELSTLNTRTLKRLCDWLDAEIHLRTHRHWHESPASFHPDPETRYLAALGNAQRHLANLDRHAQASWIIDLAGAAEHFKNSPKWAALGKAMADQSDRQWLYPGVDTLVIGLWPLVKAYNWTYRDLLTVIRPALDRPAAYPCSAEHEFAPYCLNVLGLKKAGRGRTARNAKPKGYEVVLELCPALRGSRETRKDKSAQANR